ncbi:MAG: microcystinase C [Gemmatales bacterium]|nr:MAG: microcystinase C [Gemmatales bacterium]
MRVAIAGIMHESNTFLKIPTGRREFEAGSFTQGQALIDVWRDAHHEMGGFIEGAGRFRFEAVPVVMAWATPGGPVEDSVMDEVVAAIVHACRSEAIDGLLLALHGAMVTSRHASGDTEVLRRLRTALGNDFPIIATVDFHGNITAEMGRLAQALVGYQTYPHVDQRERGILAAELMARTLKKEIDPVTAVAKPPMILNLLGQDTNREPMISLMQQAREREKEPPLLSTSVMAGFPYADVDAMGPSVIVVADGDRKAAQTAAEQLAKAMWDCRHQLYVPCPEPAEAVRMAMQSNRFPVVLVDLGDNVGGGSAGDGTVLLAELLKQHATGAVVTIFSPDNVEKAFSIGVGGKFEGKVGGAIDELHGEPVEVCGRVRSLHEGKWIETEARHGGRRHNDQGKTAVIELPGPNTLVLNSLRTPPFSLGQLTSLGIEPEQERFLVVKAAVAYKAAYAPIAGRIIEVDTPGLTAINPARFPYRHIRRPMFPLDD